MRQQTKHFWSNGQVKLTSINGASALHLDLLLEVKALSHLSGTWQVCFWAYEEGVGGRKCLNSITVCHMIFHPKELPVAVNTDCYRACNRVGVGNLQSCSTGAQFYWRWHTGEFAFPRKEESRRRAPVQYKITMVLLCTAPQISLENTSLTGLCVFFPYPGVRYDWQRHAPSFLTNKPQI